MTTRIGLVSDVHSSPVPLREALQIFARERVDEIICAGDIAGYFDSVAPTVELLIDYGCRSILGNHDQSYLARSTQSEPATRAYLQALPETLELEIERLRVLVVHANPPSEQHGGIKLLDQQGEFKPERLEEWRARLAGADYDVLIVGHTHQVYAIDLDGVFVVNPGSSVFNHSCMILSLPDLAVTTFALQNHDIVKCWNFSMLHSQAKA